MCWSTKVSLITSLFEISTIIFLFARSRLSSDPFVRKQYLLLPALTSITLMELIEAYLWTTPLHSVKEADVTCERVNQRLTIFTWLCILPWQPFFVIMPNRRVGTYRERTIFMIPEALSIIFAIFHIFLYLYTTIENDANILRSLEDSHWKSYLNSQTCTYIGLSGHHLHWAFATHDSFLTPNAFTYALLWLSILFARPLRFSAGAFLILMAVFWIQLWYFRMSFEAGSVWCFSAFFIFLYFLVQPYLLPCRTSKKGREPDQHRRRRHEKSLSAPLLQFEWA